MSLEAAIQENTSALRDLITQLKAGAPVNAAAVAETVVKSAKESSKEVKEPAPTAEVQKETAKTPASETKEATYQDAAKAVTDLAKAKGRAAAEEVLKQFGAAKLPEVKVEDFAAVIEACTKAQEA